MAFKPAIKWAFKRAGLPPARRFAAMVNELKDKGYLDPDGKLTDKGHEYCMEVCRDDAG